MRVGLEANNLKYLAGDLVQLGLRCPKAVSINALEGASHQAQILDQCLPGRPCIAQDLEDIMGAVSWAQAGLIYILE